ncbi:MAG: B12-binding domain-containing radical SAM protein [Desulfobacterales bacterium]|nr:B12-binding domain-containing radical SAM protein [Desulfobacterales bacterium]
MNILLISPKSNFPDVTPAWLRIPQLALPILAALTSPEHEVLMIEEEFERLPLDGHWDVVGISAMTATAPRAYELALLFRQNGAKVILGGIHPSVVPDEAAQFADAVVIGEAEGMWERVLYDVRRNRLRKFYHNSQPDLSESPLPVRRRMRSVLRLPSLVMPIKAVMPIMASRGCPYDCEFCCVHRVYGRRQRHIPIELIVEDIRRTGARRVMFLDDNIGGVRSYIVQLITALKPLKVSWYAQASPRFILDDELFDAAVRSGLEALFVGVESVDPEARKRIRKSLPSIHLYQKAIKRCRSAGVIFHASVIFGLDEDTPGVFERTLEFLLRNSVPSISACILTPYPGTPLFERLMREGRILHTNWSYYDHTTVCYQPKNMDPEELAERYLDFRNRFFSYSSIMQRGYAQFRVAPLVYLGTNLVYRKTTRLMEEHFRNYSNWLRQQKRTPTLDMIKGPTV